MYDLCRCFKTNSTKLDSVSQEAKETAVLKTLGGIKGYVPDNCLLFDSTYPKQMSSYHRSPSGRVFQAPPSEEIGVLCLHSRPLVLTGSKRKNKNKHSTVPTVMLAKPTLVPILGSAWEKEESVH